VSEIGYPIKIQYQGFNDIVGLFGVNQYSKVVFCIDSNVANVHKALLNNYRSFNSYILPVDGEEAKSLTVLQSLCSFFKQEKLDRHSLVIAVGGGVAGDVVGFAASIYMRGISILHVPTTLLSMVDSSVGAKTAINFDGIKNLLGSFHPPVGVLIDINFLNTLPQKHFNAGFAEIIKHGIIADAKYLESVSSERIDLTKIDKLSQIIDRSIQIKSNVVVSDPKESNIRKTLNFGHTIGHCLEILLDCLHGEAVSMGMMIEAKIAKEVFSQDKTIVGALVQSLSLYNLPTQLPPKINWNEFYNLLIMDKKNRENKFLFALPSEIGKCKYDVPVSVELIRSVIEQE
jgi:3-dehydroquinate synthase